MSIAFSCTCGKQLKARAEFAGKKFKCPGCGHILEIPRPEAAAPAPLPAPPDGGPPPLPDPLPPMIPIPDNPRLAPFLGEAAPDVPLARPVEPKAEPYAFATEPRPRPARNAVRQKTARTAVTADPWLDRTFEQTPTPWLGDDRERFNAGMDWREKPALAPIFVLAALVLAAVAIFLMA